MSSTRLIEKLMGSRLAADAAPASVAVGVSPLTSAKIIPLDRIVPDPSQPRRHFDEEELNNLAGSMRDIGQTDPVKVRWDAAKDHYVLRDGERRWRAAKIAGMTTLNAVVDNRGMDTDRVLEMQVVENALRQDLTTLEAAAAYKTLMQAWGCSQTQLADRLHISQSKVSRALKALELPDDVKEDIQAGVVAPVAAVKKASSKSGRRKTTKPKSTKIETDVGTVVVTPKPGQSVVDVLTAALGAAKVRAAA